MDVAQPKPTKRTPRKGDKNNIPEHVHREAERVAKNLFRIPAKPRK